MNALNLLGYHLSITSPNLYEQQFNMTQLKISVPEMANFLNGNLSASTDHENVYYTKGRQLFQLFGKSRFWGKDFWAEQVALFYGASFYVETWLRDSSA